MSHQGGHYTHFLKKQTFRNVSQVKSDSVPYSGDMLNKEFQGGKSQPMQHQHLQTRWGRHLLTTEQGGLGRSLLPGWWRCLWVGQEVLGL